MCKQYNGYTNYETWVVSLWMSNGEGSYLHYRELARETLEDEDGDPGAATYALANLIENDHEQANPLAGSASVFSDLMGAALGGVNWHEIAENLIEEAAES